MDDEEYEEAVDEDLLEDLSIEPRKVTAFDLFIAVWALIGAIIHAVFMFFEHTTRLFVAHRGYNEDRRDFADAIRSDLEKIQTTKE